MKVKNNIFSDCDITMIVIQAVYFVVLVQTIHSKDISRRSSQDSLGNTFANFQGPSFFQLAETGFSSASSPSYNPPITNSNNKNSYQPSKPKQPTHECSQKVDELIES